MLGIFLFLFLSSVSCQLWPKGIVHYTINKKDYDPHSQEVILSAIANIEKEICVKFFNTPSPFNVTKYDKILNIANPNKRKDCPTNFDYSGPLVEMPIGYKCMDEKSMAAAFVDMLKASVRTADQPFRNSDARRYLTFQEDPPSDRLLATSDRNFINTAYRNECGSLQDKPMEFFRRSSGGILELSTENDMYYSRKLWPFGIVMYGTSLDALFDPDLKIVQQAMATIEAASCIVFEYSEDTDALAPLNFLWFSTLSDDYPQHGFSTGNQTISLKAMAHGAPGHSAHTLNMLMRILGIHMMSNRYDRDSYVTIHWKWVEKSKEHFLERAPRESWLRNSNKEGTTYDFDSVTHAPANFMCRDCNNGEQTVQPLQDHLWQRSMKMGHRTNLSNSDIELLNLLYNRECNKKSQ